jgi:hypothetical protein
MNADGHPPQKRRGARLERLKALIAEYGALAIIVFAVISALVFAGAYAAISLGFKPASATGTMSTAGAAYVAYRLTLLFRVSAAVLLTPVVARVLERLRLRRPRRPN